jgi:hypothetical protein
MWCGGPRLVGAATFFAQPSYSVLTKLDAPIGDGEMDRAPKRDFSDGERESVPDPAAHDERAEEASRRQKAAAYLRAARLTDDAQEREELRRKAGELLSSRFARARGPSGGEKP